ncbi:MAG: ATP-binding protein [bacterium]
MFNRSIEEFIKEMLSEFRIVYVTGPRQAGKTTLARNIAIDLGMRYLSLDDQATLSAAENDPHGLIRSLGEESVVLDEFQYAPALIPAIKEASDSLKPGAKGKFLLTGSADIFRSAKVQEALPGHMARIELLPLSITEQQNQEINIVDYLIAGDFASVDVPFIAREEIAALILRGGYPEVQSQSRRARDIWFDSYIEGRLYKDFESLYSARGDYHSKVQALALYLAGLSGNLVKYANVGNDLDLDDRTTKTYIEILELMFILRRVPAYLKNRAKRLATRMPKLHLLDTGLACHLLRISDPQQLLASHHYGNMLESLIYGEFCKHAPWAQENVALYHYRDKRQFEVDLVLEHSQSRIIGIEVKASATVSLEDLRGLARLAENVGESFDFGVIFYTGDSILPFKVGEHTCFALPIGLLVGRDGLQVD